MLSAGSKAIFPFNKKYGFFYNTEPEFSYLLIDLKKNNSCELNKLRSQLV